MDDSHPAEPHILGHIEKARCDIAGYLLRSGPSLSSDIAGYLQKAFGLTAEAARQRIRRSDNPVCHLTNIGFPGRSSFLYHSNDAGTERFFECLANAYISKQSNVGDALLSIRGRGGYVHEKRFSTISGAPARPIKGHQTADWLLKILCKTKLVQEAWNDDWGVTYRASFFSPVPKEEYIAISNTEKIFSELVRRWLERLNFSTRVESRFSRANPSCNNFEFDIGGRARLRHFFSNVEGDDAAFSVGDINLAKPILSTEDVKYFVRKVDTASYSRAKQNLIPFLFAYDFSDDCAILLRRKGILHARVKHIFGDNFAELLENLCSILSNISEMLSKQPECLIEITDKLIKLEGRTQNLRSIAFQAIVAQLYFNLGYIIEIDKQVDSPSGRSVEVDIYADRMDELVCVECKAYIAGNNCPASYVNWWIEERLPRIIEWKRSHFGSKKLRLFFGYQLSFRM